MSGKSPYPDHLLAMQDEETLRAIDAALGMNTGNGRNQHEHEEQVALFQWAAMQVCVYPELEFLFAVPNGGHRIPAVAGKMKAEGTRKGVPDVWLPIPRGGYHGLIIEMKWGKNRPSADQKRWISFLRDQGYFVQVCWSWGAAREVIEQARKIYEHELHPGHLRLVHVADALRHLAEDEAEADEEGASG